MQKSVLKVNIHCDGCKHKVKKILQKIDGMYYALNIVIYLHFQAKKKSCFQLLLFLSKTKQNLNFESKC